MTSESNLRAKAQHNDESIKTMSTFAENSRHAFTIHNQFTVSVAILQTRGKFTTHKPTFGLCNNVLL
ncbi:hypothetical protein RO3G_05316 [Rhizopus delemar RA 99-880]|uniref:Uncharacterized protein n=1 Tax=Rhizopus delemar (strain RA 99-880 / ATCC MYA-4621 / FGSC 9543 / NRRL 43880) TaxID=246409 RepID=I1BWN1_RHIO9|nr:hypothetical protein RO3G_05316 [Rhizopus delemar RA 99-880]|eukprot:EIE80611.1 hypothetical protein RO3G_05316 [Rhizopus delemar RA 99-880]